MTWSFVHEEFDFCLVFTVPPNVRQSLGWRGYDSILTLNGRCRRNKNSTSERSEAITRKKPYLNIFIFTSSLQFVWFSRAQRIWFRLFVPGALSHQLLYLVSVLLVISCTVYLWLHVALSLQSPVPLVTCRSLLAISYTSIVTCTVALS